MNLHLLLANERGPALPDGLNAALLDGAPAPDAGRPGKTVAHLYGEDQTNDLAIQRWAVVYPSARPELLDAIRPLRERRQAQQRAEVMTFPLDPSDDGARLYQHLYDGHLGADAPRYVLVLGDLDEIRAEVQIRLGAAGAIGRLAFDRTEDYRAYADKIGGYEDRAVPTVPRLLLYGPHDPYDGAMLAGEADLLAPIGAEPTKLRADLELQSFGRTGQAAVDGLRAMIAVAGDARPSMLLTVSHGLGSMSWSPEDRRRRQGALRVAQGVALEADQLRERTFLPGGLWAFFACFGAGTPVTSRYKTWLQDLVSSGALSGAPDVEGTLSKDRPFVAALPKAALANPNGPLGVLGHIDLAWGWSFRDEAAGGASRAGRLRDLLGSAAKGDRFGLGLGPLGRAMRGAAGRILDLTQEQQTRALTPEERQTRGHEWMTWNDLGAWILLGDPAARLPVTAAPGLLLDDPPPSPARRAPAPALAAQAEPEVDPDTPEIEALEALILGKLAGEPDVRAHAEAQGVSWTELRRLEGLYTEAGRRAVARGRR